MPMIFMAKLTLLLTLVKLFNPYKRVVLFIYIFLGLLSGYYAAGLVVKVRTCLPISAYWRQDFSKCLNQQAILISDSVASVVSNLIIFFMPLPLVWSPRMEAKQKFRIIGVLCPGGIATGFGIYQLVTAVQMGSSSNQTILFTRIGLARNAEVGIGFICACLPALNALIERRRSDYSRRQYEHGEHKLSSVGDSTAVNSGSTTPKHKDDNGFDQHHLMSQVQCPYACFQTAVIQGDYFSSEGSKQSFEGNGIVRTITVSHDYI
ncbi:predicted protein [Uncinocarpus reesii 1704]|uniref:Rhodopsin domain-containing protein n=1 Tax=Uncinocarpus reesii (strain UAMH 1704) TaxID=336963 RepID=C4JDD9_UNCRE|nr:uncharacterized protein UREG_00305 [Uncinocarpus reesii 1704]EEP75459.1 predicted protein [Uncinocarpus reesii 1704]